MENKNVKVVLVYVISLLVCMISCYSNLELLEKQQSGQKKYEGHKVVRVFPKTKQDIDLIKSLEEDPNIEVDFWSRTRNIDIHVTPEDYFKLEGYFQNWKIKSHILNDNLQKSFDEEEKGYYRHNEEWHSNYHNFDEIMQKMNSLHEFGRTTIVNIGNSYEGKEIRGLQISNGKGNNDKQKIVVICGLHAREWISHATCMYIMENMVMQYGKNFNITKMVDRFDWVIFPVMNPDGYIYSWKKDRLWRKNRQPNPNSLCNGTDLNRNWDYEFGGSGSSKNPCSELYHGKAPFSSPEVNAIASYTKRFKEKIFCFLDIHSYSQLLMYPWSYSKDAEAKDKIELHNVAVKAVKALTSYYGTDFETGPGAVVIYEASGCSKDWAYGSMGIKYSYVFELRDTGKHGFLLPKKYIVPTAEETLAAFHSIAINMNDYENKITEAI
ncbi:zinc carboxypeptidase-like [Xenia sp. Carnegie-2017]|uniref:zinc carboxypeptidase-like n=1 Tax=Xenia sp. Carnegie-2017 TaxID=2897299 RepID=UPI001F03F4DB|nr:zinc carboxypeptidase-like [Xenia sp. Carnegie-2017]